MRLTSAAARLLRSDGSVVVPPGAAAALLRMLDRELSAGAARNGGGGRSAELTAVAEALAASALGDWPTPHGVELVDLLTYAGRVGCSTSYARRLARAGRIDARRIGHRWLIVVPTAHEDTQEAQSA